MSRLVMDAGERPIVIFLCLLVGPVLIFSSDAVFRNIGVGFIALAGILFITRPKRNVVPFKKPKGS
jgi:hypothetical protein